MTIKEIREKVFLDPSYEFIKTNPHLGDNIILLGLGGSYAYGTNIPTSDLDIRGIAVNSAEELLTNINFEQVCDSNTDTTIYSFNKIISLLSNCNPNVIEILGLKPEQYLKITPIGQKLLDNSHLFLSKKAVQTFGGYAYAQLRRLDNKSMRSLDQTEQEKHILNSINNAAYTFPDKYFNFDSDSIRLYVDTAISEDLESEIFMDVNLTHYPLRDYKAMWSEMNNIVKDYSKLGHRNKNATEHGKLAKHMMHLIRLYMMCIDILEKHQIITYREKEHDLLMSIRNGDYLDENNQPTKDFNKLLEDYQKRMESATASSTLPDKPDYKAINNFMASVNREIIINS